MKCQYCGFELAPGAIFCNSCGNKQNIQKKCVSCGAICPTEATFCTTCGKPIPTGNVIATQTMPKEKRKTSTSFIIAIILAFFFAGSMAGMLAFGFFMTEAKAEAEWYMDENDSLRNQLSKAKSEIREFQDFFDTDLLVKITSVYNADSNGNQIGSYLYENQMRYLHIDYEIIWTQDTEPDSTLYIDIYGPDGVIVRNASTSPYGHTMELNSYEGSQGIGWGNSSTSTYEAGEYTICFVYENQILCSQKIKIR